MVTRSMRTRCAGGSIWRPATVSRRCGMRRRRSRSRVRSVSRSTSFHRSGSRRRSTSRTAGRPRQLSCSTSSSNGGGSGLPSRRSRSPAPRSPPVGCPASQRPSSKQRRRTRCLAGGCGLRTCSRPGAGRRRLPSTPTSDRCPTKHWRGLPQQDPRLRETIPILHQSARGGPIMGAGSKFDQPLTLIEDGHKVIACGPLRFWACDARAEVTIQLRQGAHRAVTTKMFPNTNFDEDGGEVAVGDEEDDEWMMRATVEPYPMHKGLRSVDWANAAFVTAPNPGPTRCRPWGDHILPGGTATVNTRRGWGTRTATVWTRAGGQPRPPLRDAV